MSQLSVVFRIGILLCVVRGIQSCASIVEKGQPTEFYCTFANNPNSVTWQAIVGNNNLTINLTTCNLSSGVCTDQQPSEYNGQVFISVPRNYTLKLNIKSARRNETRFRCITASALVTRECTLSVYKWPSIPTGRAQLTSTYVELTFSTYVYPGVSAVLHRRRIDLTNADVESSHCEVREFSRDPNSDYLAVCTWRIPIGRLFFTNIFYVVATILDTHNLIRNHSAVVSQDLLVDLGTVNVTLVNCPAVIRNGQSATCTCRVVITGQFLTGQARWFTSDGRTVGVENSTDGSSILTVPFIRTDPFATYECRGINPTREYWYIRYRPLPSIL